jgi:alanine dehydrogenase
VTLLLDNADVRSVLRMRDAIDALEAAFEDYARGDAVNRPRSHTYTHRGGDRHYLFKTMDGSLPRLGVHALRLTSDLTDESDGKRVKLAATSAVAARKLARPNARVVGLLGAGWQAGAQLEGLREVLELDEVRAYAPTRGRLEAFCAEHDAMPVSSAREAVEGADVVVLATNAQRPVLDGDWLAPGTHVNSVQRHELDATTVARAELLVVRSREEPTFHFAPGKAPRATRARGLDGVVELGDVVTGAVGRTRDDQITLFTGGGGLGIQFGAVAHLVYEAARSAGIGRELPTEWFTQEEKP